MARGSLAGIVSGVVVSGLALGVASLMLPPVEMGASPPGAGADGQVLIEPLDTGLDTGAQEASGMADAATAPEAAGETAPETGESQVSGDSPETARAPIGAADEPMDAGDAPASPEPTADMPESDTAAAPEPEPAAEPLTGDESGADAASAPVAQEDDTPMRGEAAEAEITPQPAATPLPETVRAPQMETNPVKAPTAQPVEPEAIPGMELVEKLPPALPPAGPDEAVGPDETDAADMTAPAMPPDTSNDKASGSALVVEPDLAPVPEKEPAPEPESVPETAPKTAPESEPAPEPESETETAPESGPEPAPEPEAAVVPDAVTAPEPAPEAEPAPQAGSAPAPEIATIVAEPAPAPSSAPAPKRPSVVAPPASAPEAGPPPAPGLSGADKVVTGRLPTIGDDEPAEEAPEAGAPGPDTAAVAPETLPAIERNRIEFAAEGDQPLLALLLLDSGDRAALEDIGKLPFPLTVAVDASAPDAAEAIEFYAKRGIEVALLLPLPEGATPADVDVTVEAYKPLLDEAAEVVVDSALGFQALGAGAVQLATNLAETGHGLVSFPSGLNTGYKSALKQGVPAGLVFLDLDGDGQGAPVIRRFLDNAAFRARNEDGVIVLARTRPETLQALLEWSLGSRAQTVTLAPISAVLLSK